MSTRERALEALQKAGFSNEDLAELVDFDLTKASDGETEAQEGTDTDTETEEVQETEEVEEEAETEDEAEETDTDQEDGEDLEEEDEEETEEDEADQDEEEDLDDDETEDEDLEEDEEEEDEDGDSEEDDADEDEDEEEEEDEEEDEAEKASLSGNLAKLAKAGKKKAPAASDNDPDGDGDNDTTSTPAFILSVLQAMRSSAEHSGDLDSARMLGQACSAIAAHRVNDPAEATPGAPGHKPNKQGGTSIPAGKDGSPGMGPRFYMAQQIRDLIKASYGDANNVVGTGGKGVKLIKPSKQNPAEMGGKGTKPKGAAPTNASAVGRKSPGASGMQRAKTPAKSKPGGTFSHASNKAAGSGNDLEKTVLDALNSINSRLERIEGQPAEGGPALRGAGTAVNKSLGGASGNREEPMNKVAVLQQLAAQETDPYLKKEYGEMAAKAELRGFYNFQN